MDTSATHQLLINNLKRAYALTTDLIQHLPEEALGQKLGDLPSNTIGEQLWCMIGARESYLQAVVDNEWSDFGCSLSDTRSKAEVLRALENSENTWFAYLDEHALNENQATFLMELLTHELQHHGQLIRYVYGNRLGFPASWHDRYTV
jgi:hypothetical protein